MFSKKPTEGKRKHKEDNFDSFSYQCLDDLICSDKKDATAVDNIEDLVDSALAKNKVSSYDERVKNNYFVDSTDRLWRHGGIRKVLGIVNKPLVRKVLSILLSFLLVFVTIVSASILSPQGSSDLEVLSVSLVPENVHNGDYMSVNVTVLGSYHICSVMADMGGIETINLLLSDNSSLEQLWQTVWVVHDVDVGEYVATITALDEENTSYRSEVRWSVLPQEIIEDNVSSGNGDTIDNDTLMGENESLNVNNPLDNQTSNITEGGDTSLNDTPQQVNVLDNTTEYDNVSINVTTNESIDVSTTDGNQSARATYLNITLNTDKDSYLVNETVFISGTVVFNNSFVETTVNLSINSSDNSFLYTINTANGAFSYEYIASKSGNYIVGAHAIFENETASINTLFIVNDITDETDDVTVLSLIQGEAVVGESVFWEKKIMVKNNASIQRTLNIATTIPDAVSNIKIQDVSEGNEVNYTVLVNQIAEKNVSEQISGSTSIMFNGTFDAWGEREFTITYETPTPIKQEISYDGGKRIEIQSNATVHYSNVTAYTELPELSYKPRFYRVINGTRVDVTFDPLYNVTYLDNNSNGKYDGISWNVPRLSNDTYEIDITIIDVQSYPVVGGNWTVRFTTTGTANLTIRAVNGTAFDVDLEFLELKYGDNILTTELTDGVIFVENYSCDEIGYEISKVLIAGEHTLEFRFGDDVEYAFNAPGLPLNLWVNDFTWAEDAWTEEGTDPYLDAIEGTNYITDNAADTHYESRFNFSDSSDLGVINDVKICLYAKQDSGDNGEIEVFLYNSTGGPYSIVQFVPTAGSYDWSNTSCLTYLPTWSEINDAQLRVRGERVGGADILYVDAAVVWVDYSPITEPYVTTNASTGVEETNATLRGYLSSDGGATTTCGFRYGTSPGSYSENFSKGTYSSGTEFSNYNSSLTQGQIYHYQAWANNSAGFANGTERSFLAKPSSPSSLNAQANSTTMIYLSWPSLGTGANTTYIERNTVSSWARGAGAEVYNGTDLNHEDSSGISAGNTYYYQAWGFTNWTNATTTLYQWSDTYTSAGPVTAPTIPTVLTNASTGVEETNATLRGYLQSNGSADTYTYFLWGNSTPPHDMNISKGITTNQTEIQYDASGLPSGNQMYFDTKANSSAGWDQTGGILSFFTKPEDPDSITCTTTTSTTADFSIDKADMGTDATSYTYTRYQTGTFPTTRAQGTLGFNSTSTTPQITSLSSGTHYYLSAWAWGEENSTGAYSDTYITCEFNTTSLPVIQTNASTGVEETNATLRGYLQSNGSADTTCGFRFGTSTGSYSENFSLGVTANQTEFSNDNSSLTSGDVYYYQAWANNSAGFANGSELKFFTKPPAVTNLAESISTNTSLTYTWTNATVGNGATNYTRIQWDTSTYPGTISSGNNTYNGTGTSDSTTSLNPGTRYYFSAFSWGIEDGVGNWNDTYDTMDAWTNPGDPTSVDTTNGSTWVNVTFTHGQNGEYTMVVRNESGYANYPNSRTNGTEIYNDTGAYKNDTGLVAMGVTYYHALWTWDPDGGKWCDYQTNITGTTEGAANNPPQQTNQRIWNSTTSTEWDLNATGVSLTPTCFNVTLIDNDNENMNVTLYWNDSGTWKNINDSYSDGGVANNTVWHAYNTSWINSYSTQYNISFNVTDGTDWSNETKNFTTLINTSVDTITPYNVTSSTLTINATGDFGLDNVTLWYQYSTDNSSWGGWMENITDTSSLWQWSFNFSKANGTGYYEFYSIGKKSGSPDETAPASADAICRYLPFNVSPITWPIGSINLSENTSTTGFYFNLTNDGNISLNVQINATNATNSTTGFKWNLTSTLGHNNYTLQYNKSGGGTWTQINTSFDSFATLAVDGYQTFDLKIFMATTSDELDPMFLTVTFKYVAS